MCRKLFILLVLPIALFFVVELAFSTHRIYKCPSASSYHRHLISGKTLALCPTNKKQCQHKVLMSSYLKSYGGYPPKTQWKVVSAKGYKHKQCHYTVSVLGKNKEKKTLPGYMRIKLGGMTDCKDAKARAYRFKCKIKNNKVSS